jgi:hypothetical protein
VEASTRAVVNSAPLATLVAYDSHCNWETHVSTDDAQRYARRARNASSLPELGDAVRRAIEALIEEIEELEDRISQLETEK